MLINCVICSDLLTASEDVSTTLCGHLFHYVCLAQWFERSKTCPQCRSKTTEKSIHRVFFNVSNQVGLEDASSLQHKIDSLTFEIMLKNKDISNAKEKLLTLNNNVFGLKEELHRVENKCASQNTSIKGLQKEVKTLKNSNKNNALAEQECKRLRLALQDLQEELNGSKEKRLNLENQLRKTEFLLEKSESEKDELCTKVSKLLKVKEKLKADIKHIEDSKKSLQFKIQELEKAIVSPSAGNPRDKALRRLLTESPAPTKKPCLTNPMDVDESESPSILEVSTSHNLPVTPNLMTKHQSHSLAPLRITQKPNFILPTSKHSIFKNSRENFQRACSSSLAELDYDGLGGHCKYVEFPKPVTLDKFLKQSKTSVKSRKTMGQKLKLHNYFDLA